MALTELPPNNSRQPPPRQPWPHLCQCDGQTRPGMGRLHGRRGGSEQERWFPGLVVDGNVPLVAAPQKFRWLRLQQNTDGHGSNATISVADPTKIYHWLHQICHLPQPASYEGWGWGSMGYGREGTIPHHHHAFGSGRAYKTVGELRNPLTWASWW
jgi:hypothetical protein